MTVIPVNLPVSVDQATTMNSVDRVQGINFSEEVPVQRSVVDANRLIKGHAKGTVFWVFGNGQLILFGNGTSIETEPANCVP